MTFCFLPLQVLLLWFFFLFLAGGEGGLETKKPWQVRFFILGDSSFGGGGVDEVGALHYGADCIVRFGHADQQRGGSLPVLFVLGSGEGSSCQQDAEKVARALDGLGNSVPCHWSWNFGMEGK